MKHRYFIIFSTLVLAPSAPAHATDSQWLDINKMVVAQNDIAAASGVGVAAAQDAPMGQSATGSPNLLPTAPTEDNSDDSLFGTPGGGYFHPFLSLKGEYTDNLFNVKDDTKSNFLTTLTPGIWLAAPQLKEVPIAIISHNTSAGGLQMDLPEYKGFDRYNAYLLGSTDLKFYSEDSDLNDNAIRLEGLFKYNLRSGLSFRAVDRFSRDQDRFDAGNAYAIDKLREYNSNLALGDVKWDFSEKFQAKVGYSNFWVDYKDDIVEFLNRSDNTFFAYGYYKYSVKTALFLQYQYIDVSYDTASLRDNSQDFIFAGINWKSSEKTTLTFKAGYQDRSFKNDIIDATGQSLTDSSNSGLALEMDLQYQIREKSKLTFTVNRKIDESDSYTAFSKEVLGATLRYQQKFTDKIEGFCDLSYERDDYNQVIGSDRKDDRYVFRPSLRYTFRDWLMLELAYQYDTRSSSETLYDYDTNTISLSFNTAL